MKIKKIIGILTGMVVSVSVMGTIVGCNLERFTAPQYSRSKMNQLNKYLDYSFLGDMDQQKIMDSLYAGYVSGLEDPSTVYLNEEEYAAEKIFEKGQYIGTGIFFTWGISGNEIIVTQVLENSPAEKAGIKVGDKIIQIDEIGVRMANQVGLYEKLAYTGSQKVTYVIQDNSGKESRTVELVSEVIHIPGLKTEILEGNRGYIEMKTITPDTSEELAEALKSFKEKQVKDVILDVRYLTSRNLEEIVEICDLFIEDQLLFKVQDKTGNFKEYKGNAGISYDGKVVLLVNEGTSGTVEAMVSTLKEVKKMPVVGSITSGNGVVTQCIDLKDKTGVRVTTGIIYSISEVSLKGKGIAPDIAIKNTVESAVELMTSGEISLKNDAQLMKALEQF
ncbi:hypothetical protein CS063_06095 [Sporanaerobium hydrogeniformans]|uniref:Uncharacterized protein n=1 Tax=Sporanaerobium hydrogeniformans TaxID=3072179 RepID=A0AC61DED0_9FIRM|nr:S41 family peptidase [Sporanaerobium hydrogeniformans]PHV71260.1 hypothetical protein CS063_06095 [Sporanaerobium hydrogeniformans]